MPLASVIQVESVAPFQHLGVAFAQGLQEAGFIEGQNVAIEYRYADNQPDRLAALVTDLVRRPVAVIVGNNPSALAAKAATTMIPIVFATGADPVKEGLVDSLNRPGGNVTGVSFLGGLVGAKRLELLRQVVPKVTTVAMLMQPNRTETELERKDVQDAARAIGLQLITLDVSSDRDIETAFATLVKDGAGALLVGTGAYLASKQEV
jgi:putative tryptophan/tyrosine transport system substrate-binding protein